MIVFRRISKSAITYLALLLFFAIIYSSVIETRYAFLDDYNVVFLANNHGIYLLARELVAGGRPIYALLSFIFIFVSQIGELRWIRLLSVAGIAALCMLFMRHLRETTTLPRSISIAGGMLIGLMPAFQVYASWAVTAFDPWAAFLAGLSFSKLNNDLAPRWKTTVLSVVFLICAMAIYQPAAMMYWVFAGAAWVAAEKLPSLEKIIRAVAVMGTALALDYAAAKLLPILIFHDYADYSRTALVTNFEAKAWWFLTEVMQDALNLPSPLGGKMVAILAALFIGAGFVILMWRERLAWGARATLAILLLPLAYTPNLIVQENWASYRTQVALTSLLVLYFVMALSAWLRVCRIDRFATTFIFAAILGCAWMARHDVDTEFTIPQVKELHLVSSYLRKEGNLAGAKEIYIVPARWQDSLAPFVRYDEFGTPSSQAAWSAPGLIWAILSAEHSPVTKKLRTAIVGPVSQAPKGATVVDLDRALRGLPPPDSK